MSAEPIPCKWCKGTGTVVIKGSMWWQDQHLRCTYCQGSGRLKAPPEPEGEAA